ncbi:hypothetical protein RN001_010380 [Aquatica leii]|uniref:Cytochrome P450 n=1 Tax=Aquatica leii TaxID=1421715 RepID=A0AAN7SG01_9COLE|nr:hypothetical protein RN001_010380 [Aquatica leii]
MNDFDHFDDRTVAGNMDHDKISTLSLLMLKNPEWKISRSRFTATLSIAKIKNMIPLVVKASEDFVTYLENVQEDVTECRELSIKYAIDVLSSCALGLNPNSFSNSDFYKKARNLQNSTTSRVIHSACYFFSHSLVRLFHLTFLEPASVKFLKHVFLNNVDNRKKLRNSRGDLIDLLLKLEEDNESFRMDENGLAIGLEYLTAGYVSSATTLSFLLYELCLHQTVQERIREEIKSVLGTHGGISYESVQEMKYLDMAFKEALRKFPVLPFLDRCCTKPYTIPNTDITIDKGINVYIPLMGLHYDPKYFPEPEKFKPERFSPENKDNFNDFAYLPFGEGRRNCIGSLLGALTVKIAVIQLLTYFKLEKSAKTPDPIVLENVGFFLIPQKEEINIRVTKLVKGCC